MSSNSELQVESGCDTFNCDTGNLGARKTPENNNAEQSACFVCRKNEFSDPDCKTCTNICAYFSKKESQPESREDEPVDIPFPGPAIVKRNRVYGNYVVAARTIEPNEIIILETPLNIGPYGPSDVLPLCVTCCKDVGLSSKCSKCRWPVCGIKCEQFPLHEENECRIFSKMEIKAKCEVKEYFCVEVLRTLLLREKNPAAWARVLEFEPHVEARSKDLSATLTTDYITEFIVDKCGLGKEYTPEIIDHVVGVLSVNTFWALKDLSRYASCLFDKITLFAHDCDPNTNRQLVFLDEEETESSVKSSLPSKEISNRIASIAQKVTASRRIDAGEMITIRYIDIDQPFTKRREELKDTFYFDCTCSRCLLELGESTCNKNLENGMVQLEIA